HDRKRERDFDLKSSAFQVAGSDLAVVEFDRALRDGKTQSDAAGPALARSIHTIERLEQIIEFRIRNSRTVILDDNPYLTTLALGADSYRRFRFGIANRIPHHVLERTAQKLLVTFDSAFLHALERNGA